MARLVIQSDDGTVYSTFRIRPANGWGEQLTAKIGDIIHDLQEVLEKEERSSHGVL